MNTVDPDFPHPIIIENGKRFARCWHVAQYSGKPVGVVTRLVDRGEIAAHLFNAQVYIDIDEALAVLSKITVRRKTAKVVELTVDLFA
jgi:hypothetical protein